jgi:phosphate transport system protein
MTQLDDKLNTIRERTAAMSLWAKGMYLDALSALARHDQGLARELFERDKTGGLLELEIDELCLQALALYSPKGAELRYLVAVLRLIADLERVGDHSKTIAAEIFSSHCAALLPSLSEYSQISTLPSHMLDMALDTFFRKDESNCQAVIDKDREVGRLQTELNRAIARIMAQNPDTLEDGIALINVLRRMERVADHAKNIAELTPYVTSGKVLRHIDIFAGQNGKPGQ